MTALFLYLVNRGITASFLILGVIGLRFLFRKLPKNPQLLLWALVALRLAVPFTGPSGTENGLLVVCTLLWLLGAAGMLTYCLAAYLRLRKKLSVSLRLDGNVYLQKDVLDGLTVQDHLYRMLLFNQYDSAYALAYSVFGGEAAAVEQMNAVTMEICQQEPFRGLYNQNTGTLPIEGLAKLISTMLEKPLLNKIWHAASYTVPSTQELVYSMNALLPGNPLVLNHISQDSRVTGGLTARSEDYADLAVTAEYGGKRVLCVLTGALRVSHPYMDNPSSYDVVDYWGNYEEMEKLLNIAFG